MSPNWRHWSASHPFTKEIPMPRPQYYSPAIERFLVSVLYHEGRHRKMPMTQLANQILKTGLADSAGWQLAMQSSANSAQFAGVKPK
jgi:hypothetical protein